jgi:Zn-dependent M16 (insulinase) family peptidase
MYALDYILLMSPSAPLRRAGIESGLGDGIATWGLSLSDREATFSFGLKGVDPANCQAVEDMVLGAFRDLARYGIDQADIEAGLNQYEFELRENDTGSTPQAFTAAREVMGAWMYDRDVVDSVKFEDALTEVRSRIASTPRYLEGLIEQYFLNNKHRTTVNLLPDEGLAGRLAEEERSELARIEAALTDEDRQKIDDDLAALRTYQNTPDPEAAVATIPRLSVSDLNRDIERITTNESAIAGATALHHDVDTRGLSYVKAVYDLEGVPERLRPYGRVFARLLFESGTSQDDYVGFQRRIGAATGGIGAGISVNLPFGEDSPRLELQVGGKATDAKASEMIGLMSEGVLDANLTDQQRTLQIVRENKSAIEQGVISSGHSVVSRRLGARLSEAGRLGEQLYGVEQLEFLKDLEDRIKSDWAGVQQDLEDFRTAALGKDNVLLSFTGSTQQFSGLHQSLSDLVSETPEIVGVDTDHRVAEPVATEALVVPSEVNYVGKGISLPVSGDRLTNAYSVVEKYLNRKYLWDEVRVKGGAYGAFASLGTQTGSFTAASYRDKNLLETLEVFNRMAEHLKSVDISQEELDGMIISAISSIDTHKLPPAKGASALARYRSNLDDDTRQVMRDEIFAASIDDFRSLGELLSEFAANGMVSVLGPPASADALKQEFGDSVETKQVL